MIKQSQKITTATCLSQLRDQIAENIEKLSAPKYEPSGLQEDIILTLGRGNYQIVVALHPNDVGKTTAGVNILKNIIWPHDPTWFSWWEGRSIFRDRQFPVKRFRIASEHTYISETGAIQVEIENWWPKGQYIWEKGGKPYPSQCTILNSQWSGDALSYTQDRKQFESIKIDFLWTDEPATPELVGALTSRFTEAENMLWLVTATPIKCGPFLDILSDLKDKGTRVKYLTDTAYENSKTSGKPNHLGTKKGLRSDESIAAKIATTPLDERDARCFGKANSKAGRIYYDFDRSVHVRDYDLSSDFAKKWNCFMTMDPHPKAFPFIQWWGITPDTQFVCYNEWPTLDFLKGFYDEYRDSAICNYDAEMLARFMKIFDGTQYGLNICGRFLDPRPARQTEHMYGRTNESLLTQYAKVNIDFTIPPAQLIEVQRDVIRKHLKFDKQLPVSAINEPDIYIMPHCENTIRMLERHYWDEDKECEAEKYKEGPDCMRFFFAGIGDYKYKIPQTTQEIAQKKKFTVNPIIAEMNKQLTDCNLG